MEILNSSSSNQGNLAAVLKQLRINGTQSNAELSRTFKVPAGTTARHLKYLEEMDLIRKASPVPKEDKTVGKPPVLYEINPDIDSIMAVEVNKHKIRIAGADFRGRILFTNEYPTAPKEEIAIQIKSLIDNQLKDWPKTIPIPGCISLGVSAVVSRNQFVNGKIFPANLNLGEILSQDIDIPVLIANDANLAVIGEKNFGNARDASDIVCILDSYDFGLGLFINGSLYKGAHGRAGETTINKFYSQENQPWKLAGGLNLENAIKNNNSIHTDFSDHTIVYQLLAHQAAAGDKKVRKILKQLANELAEETIRLFRLFDPEKIIIAGNVVEAGELFKEMFLENLRLVYKTDNKQFKISQITFSDLKQKIVIMGAVAIGIDKLIYEFTKK
jgi:N-acetylglucosamine repressor